MDKQKLLANPVNLKGFFTMQLYLEGQSLREIERRVGFDAGRLAQGAWFATPLQLPKPDDFELAGYSQVAGHHTKEIYGKINEPVTDQEKQDYLLKKRQAMSQWQLNGSNRLIKIIPMTGHDLSMSDDFQYPPGSGIPQWKMIRWVLFYGICYVKDYPNGKFIC